VHPQHDLLLPCRPQFFPPRSALKARLTLLLTLLKGVSTVQFTNWPNPPKCKRFCHVYAVKHASNPRTAITNDYSKFPIHRVVFFIYAPATGLSRRQLAALLPPQPFLLRPFTSGLGRHCLSSWRSFGTLIRPQSLPAIIRLSDILGVRTGHNFF